MKQVGSGLMLFLVTPIVMAVIPATKQYVDTQFAGIQAQIDTINQNNTNTPKIGDCYGGGVVFYVNNSSTTPGQRGLIAALTDVSGTSNGVTLITGCTAGTPATCRWWQTGGVGTTPTVTYQKNAYIYFSGNTNTQNILATTTSGTWSAAEAAQAYNTTNPAPACNGCTNWYLPSQAELNAFYSQQVSTANFGQTCPGYQAPVNNNTYWSSSQFSGFPVNAWYVNFNDGNVFNDDTTNPFPVRAVRAF